MSSDLVDDAVDRGQAETDIAALTARLHAETASKDVAYEERNRLVALLSSLYPASLERHPPTDTEWEDDWRWIVFIEFPGGQATWHIHDSHLSMFDHLDRNLGWVWDGHTTKLKYERIEEMVKPQPRGLTQEEADAHLQNLRERAEKDRQVWARWDNP